MGQQTKGSRLAGKADTTSGAMTGGDLRAHRAASRERDKPLEAAYNAGRRGDDPAEFQTDDELWGYYQDGQKAARAERRGERREQLLGSTSAKAGNLANDGAGFLLGLLAYALLANYLRNGMAGVRGWLSAKFLNEPMAASGVTAPARPARPSGPAAAPAPPRTVPLTGGGM